MRGLFINNAQAKDSIHISGKMVYDCICLEKSILIDYIEISDTNREINTGYDFYFFNYHPHTMSWLDTKSLRKLLGCVGTIVLEVLPNDPFVMCPENHFDFYCVLDPTVKIDNKRVFPFPRPLPLKSLQTKFTDNEIPVIGTFGFATKGKGFQHVVEAVNNEFESAIVKINIPYGDFVPNSKEYASFLEDTCKKKAKEGIKIIVTNDFMTEDDLLKWCSSNTLNCFLYDRKMPGLSATTDQAIMSGRPLAVSENETFRHITQYLNPYPKWSLKDSIAFSIPIVSQLQTIWSPVQFAEKFKEMILSSNIILNSNAYTTQINLRIKKNNIVDWVTARAKKYRRKFTFKNIKARLNDSGSNKEII